MTRLALKVFPALVVAALAATVAPVCDAAAQDFNSVSSVAPSVSVETQPLLGVAPSVAVETRSIAPSVSVVSQPFGSASSLAPATTTESKATSIVPPSPDAAGLAPLATTASLGPAGGQPYASQGFSSISGATPSVPTTTAASGPARDRSGSVSYELADKVLVDKSERRLYLLRGTRVIAEYPIKLGLNPYGHKQREGDFRTPEGKYALVRRNPQSDFFLSIQVSYPNREDAAVAKESGFEPGGLIMIHGQPNVPKRAPEFYATRDWTDGCIALSNSDMIDVWQRTTLGIPIEIRP